MKNRILISTLLQFILLSSVAVFTYASVEIYTRDVARQRHIRSVALEIDNAEIRILERQSAVRGYAASKDPYYLDTIAREPLDLAPLKNLVRDENAKKKLLEIEPLLIKRNEIILDSISKIEAGGMTQEQLLENMKETSVIVSRVRKSLDELKKIEYDLLQRAEEDAREAHTRLNYATLFLIITGMAFLSFSVYSSYKGIQRIEDLKAEVEESNKELEQFVYIASHDLQEPLRTVSSYCQLIERRYADKLDDSGKEFITFVIEGTVRMKQLINDLLQYSRSGRIKEFETFEVRDVLNEVVNVLDFEHCDIHIAKMPKIRASRVGMQQIFQNLLSNSIKFSKKDCMIWVKSEELKEYWKFSVKDSGIGIPQELQHKLFQPFQRLNVDKPGNGIGLAIVKKIVEAHEGEVWVESEEGAGATFHFTIKKEL